METAVESTVSTVEAKRAPWLISKENAKEMSRKAVEARQRMRQEQSEPETPPIGVQTTSTVDRYATEEVIYARAEIKRLQELAAKLTEPADIERMARAINQWGERERILAGRPLPGSHRPAASRSRQSGPSIEPV